MPYWGEFSPFPGTGNISKDPMFIDIVNNDYRLKEGSPCENGADDGYNMGAYLGIWKPPKPPADTIKLPERAAIAYPNPTKTGQVTFFYHLDVSAEVTIRVYNVAKELVSFQTENKQSGNQRTIWYARGLAAGIYIYQITTKDQATGKVENWKRQKLAIIR